MIPISKALKIITRETPALGSERINLADAVGRVLAENIVADSDLPPFDRSQMDGYALRAADTTGGPVQLKIIGESAAGRGWHKFLKEGEAVRIMTGAPVPAGADAVQKIELTSEIDNLVSINEPTKKGRFIVTKGKEIKKGRVVSRTGEIITGRMISVPAAFGYPTIKVASRPRVSIISTGSEIVEIDQKPKRDQIRNSNSIMLKSLCERNGATVTIFPIVGDDISDLKSQISNAVRGSDIVVTTGGVSVGKYDLTKDALREMGAEIFFERVALKPGKPTVFAKLKKTLIFSLPGNPVSAAVTYYLFVRKAILHMQAAAFTELRSGTGVVAKAVKGTKERDTYLPSTLSTNVDGQLVVEQLNWHGSSDFVGFARCQALLLVPKGSSYNTGAAARFLFL